MYRWEQTQREDRYHLEKKNPSFSSTLLDKIYRSIDEGDQTTQELKFYRETMGRKQSRASSKINRGVEEEKARSPRQACSIEKWMEKKVSAKVGVKPREYLTELERRLQQDHDPDHDVLFFSSTSSSSDSSSGGLSSSDTESVYGLKSSSSCFLPPRPKPVRTSVSHRPERSEKTGKKERALSHQQRELHMFDNHRYISTAEDNPKHEEAVIKSKSRALKIYANLKKVKQPISPGGRLANFINSLFTSGNTKKKKKSSSPSIGGYSDSAVERKSKSVQTPTCSSASSFSRSCLSKNSPSSREKLRNGVKRNVRFGPVSVIVDEDCRPCGHKCLYEEEESSLIPVSVPTAWKIGRSPTTKNEELKFPVIEKTRRVEDVAGEFLRDYRQNQKKNELITRDFLGKHDVVDYEVDDASSCSSSDLFELDHLAVMADNRYSEELPVYETTHIETNRAIANGFIM